MNGSCLCEGVSFSVQEQPEKVIACYCSHCSKNAGAPGQYLGKYHRDNVKIATGEQLLQTFTLNDTSSGSPKHKIFCGKCGCTLWTIPTHHGSAYLMVRTSLLDRG
ncbi:Mss4-like protein [Lipomyces doorenjongii]